MSGQVLAYTDITDMLGAHRYQTSKWAGKRCHRTIQAFIDDDYNLTAQVIGNLQRENLTTREIAGFMGRELFSGEAGESGPDDHA